MELLAFALRRGTLDFHSLYISLVAKGLGKGSQIGRIDGFLSAVSALELIESLLLGGRCLTTLRIAAVRVGHAGVDVN